MSTSRQPRAATAKGPEEWFSGDVYFNAYYRVRSRRAPA